MPNNSKSFANGSKSMIRKNLGLYKQSDIYLIYLELSKTISWRIYWYKNVDLARKDISNKLMIFGSDRK